jgi:phosphatidylinositol glycan class S
MPPKAEKEASASTDAAGPKSAPPEKPSHARRRLYIILSYWLVVIFLGLPLWWKTTAIYRANLPLDGMMEWADGKVSTRLAAIAVNAYSCLTMNAPFV